jgi:hypothetical protein
VRGVFKKFCSFFLSTPQERTRVSASVCLLTFKNKFFIIPLEKGVQNGGFAMNSLDENYAHVVLFPAVLTFHFFTPQSLSIKPKNGGNHESQLNNFPHLRNYLAYFNFHLNQFLIFSN